MSVNQHTTELIEDLKDIHQSQSMEQMDISEQLQHLNDIQFNFEQLNEYDEMAEDQTDLLQLLLQSEDDAQQQFDDLMRKSQVQQMEMTMNAEIDALNQQLTNKKAEVSRLKKVISNRNNKLQSLSRKRRKSFLENIRISELKEGLNDKTKELEDKENEIVELKQMIATRAGELRRLSHLSEENNLAMHYIQQSDTERLPLIDIFNLFQSTWKKIEEADLDFGIEDVDFDIIMNEQQKINKITRRVTKNIEINNAAIRESQGWQSDESSDRDEFIDKLQSDIQELRGVIQRAKSQQNKQNEEMMAANEHNLETEDKIEELKKKLRDKGDQLNYLANLIENLRKKHQLNDKKQQKEIQRLRVIANTNIYTNTEKTLPMMDLTKLAQIPIHVDDGDEFEQLVKIKLQDLMDLRSKLDKSRSKSSILQRVSVAHNVSATLFDRVERLKKVISNRNHKLAAMWRMLKHAENEVELNAMKEEMQQIADEIDDGFNDGHLKSLQHRLSGKNRQIAELQQLVEEYKENKQLKAIEAEEKDEEFEILKATLRSTMENLAEAQNLLNKSKQRYSRISGDMNCRDIWFHEDINQQHQRQQRTMDEKSGDKNKSASNVVSKLVFLMALFIVGLIGTILYSDASVNIDDLPGIISNGVESVKEFGADFDLKDLSQKVGQSVFDFVVKLNEMTGVKSNINGEQTEKETYESDPNADNENKDKLIIKLQRTIQNKNAKLRSYTNERKRRLQGQKLEIQRLKRHFPNERIEEMKAIQSMIDNKNLMLRAAHNQFNSINGLEQCMEKLTWYHTAPYLLPMNATNTNTIKTNNHESTNVGEKDQDMKKKKENWEPSVMPKVSGSTPKEKPFIGEETLLNLMGLLFSTIAGVVVYQALMHFHLPTLPWYKLKLEEKKRWKRRNSTGRLASNFDTSGLKLERVN